MSIGKKLNENVTGFEKDLLDGLLRELEIRGKDYAYEHVEKKSVNVTKSGVAFMHSDGELGINIYFSDLYAGYKKMGNEIYKLIAEMLIKELEKADEKIKAVEDAMYNLDSIGERIQMQLINTAMNLQLLETVPHRSFLNLSVIYRLAVGKDLKDGSAIITNEHMSTFKMTEEMLYKHAMENGRDTVEVLSLSSMVLGASVNEDEPDLFVLTNKERLWGASMILYPDNLKLLETVVKDGSMRSNSIGSKIYLIPSSIHEWLAVDSVNMEVEDLREIIMQVTQTELDEEDILSYDVYSYDGKTVRIEEKNSKLN